MKNINDEIEEIVQAHELSFEETVAIDLNEKCVVTMRLMPVHTYRDDNGMQHISDIPQDTFISAALQVTQDLEPPKGYSMVYPEVQIYNEDRFFEFMITANKNAENIIKEGKVIVPLEYYTT